MKPINILVADDHPDIITAIRYALSDKSRYKIAGEFKKIDQVRKFLFSHQDEIDIIILDLDFGGGKDNGANFAADLKKLYQNLKIIVYSAYLKVDHEAIILRLLKSGVDCLIEKSYGAGEILKAITFLKAEKYYLSENIKMYHPDIYTISSTAKSSKKFSAKMREIFCLKHFCGLRDMQIADFLGLPYNSIKSYIRDGFELLPPEIRGLNAAAKYRYLIDNEYFQKQDCNHPPTK